MAYVDESGVTTLTNEIKSYIQTYFLDLHYPVGSIYLSVNNTNPTTLFGGTWEQIQDKFLLAAGNTYAAGATGGEAEHTLTIDEMPSHSHEAGGNSTNSSGHYFPTGVNAAHYTGGKTVWWFDTSMTGNSQPHNNMPPYFVVYMWKRVS